MHRSEFEKFATAIRPRLAYRATAVTGDVAAAEDIVQNCLLKLWTIRETLDDYSSPEALALTIVHRMSLNALRDKRQHVELIDDAVGGFELSPEELAIENEAEQSAEDILSMLPDAQQAIIRMRHVDGMSNSEIARTIGSTDGAVRTALSRARIKIAEMFFQRERNQNI